MKKSLEEPEHNYSKPGATGVGYDRADINKTESTDGNAATDAYIACYNGNRFATNKEITKVQVTNVDKH